MCGDESGVSRSRVRENVRWRLVGEVRHRVEHGGGGWEGRGARTAAVRVGGAAV